MPINKFTTLLDLSRQSKIITGETATFDGKIQAGIPFSGYPTGVNVKTKVSLGIASNQNAILSGNTGTTLFDVANPLSPNYNPIFNPYSGSTWSNPLFSIYTSGLTLPITPLSAETQTIGPFWTLTQTGYTGDYIIGTQYTGFSITYSFNNIVSTGIIISGITNAVQENFSAGTLDYKGPLDYLSSKENITVDGRLITNKITISNGASSATTNYILTQTDSSGNGGWVDLSSVITGICFNTLNVTNLKGCSPITIWDSVQSIGSTASGLTSFAFGNTTLALGYSSHAEGESTTSFGGGSHSEGIGTNSFGDYSHAEGSYSISSGNCSHAEGSSTISSGFGSHSEGGTTISSGNGSHAEGLLTLSSGNYSHAEGNQTISSGNYSHAEGLLTLSSGNYSHAEGFNVKATGDYSHAEGLSTSAITTFSHAEGTSTLASGSYSHAEGSFTKATNFGSHAEGTQTNASGISSHAEGNSTISSGIGSHSEGLSTSATSNSCHSEGIYTLASNLGSHAEGDSTLASGQGSHSEGYQTTASGNYSHSEGEGSVSIGLSSHAEGANTISLGNYSHAEGESTRSVGNYSHSEGFETTATTSYSHSEGSGTLSSGLFSHSEGLNNISSGVASHAEGTLTIASGNYSHSEGFETIALGGAAHSEGIYTSATTDSSHAEGDGTLASGISSHAEGYQTTASGNASHAEGWGTTAYESYQHVSGRWNNTTNANQYFIIGRGTSNASRSNAFRVDSAGNVYGAGATYNSGADYAEYFESLSGDSLPFGTVVELEDDKIKVCVDANNAIGVISSNPTLIGNNEDGTADEWVGKYEKDEWGRYVMEDYTYEIPDYINESGDTIYKTVTEQIPKLSINYDPNIVYIPRSQRSEWNVVGLVGQVRILKNQQIPSRWIKMKDINTDIALYLIR